MMFGLSDKQNLSIISNTCVNTLSNSLKGNKYLAKWQIQDSSDSDSDADEKIINIVTAKKRKSLKQLIMGMLQERKQHDFATSRIEIWYEHIKFKIFQAIKAQTERSSRTKAEADIMRQTREFQFLRRSFKEWRQCVSAPKREVLARKREIFLALRQICSIQISLRIRRIILQSYLIKKRGKQLTEKMSENFKEELQQSRRAQEHRQQHLKNKAFHILQQNCHKQKHDQLRYKQYKLASIFRKRTLLVQTFKAFRLNYDHSFSLIF